MMIDPRIDQLEALSRVRPLEVDEALQLERFIRRERERKRQLPRKIAAARAQLAALVEQLSPADRLRELRAEARLSWERLRTVEEALEPGAHLARLEAELGRGAGNPSILSRET